MKKIYLIVQQKDINSALNKLRIMGNVHVEQRMDSKTEDIKLVKNDILLFNNAINILREQKGNDNKKIEQKNIKECKEKAEDIIEMVSLIGGLNESILKRNVLIDYWKEWGNFSLKDTNALKEKGLYIYLCEISKKELCDIPKEVSCEIINKKSGILKCMLISQGDIDLPFKKIELPKDSLNNMIEINKRENAQVLELKEELRNNICYLEAFQNMLLEKEEVLKFEKVEASMNYSEELAWLKGFCPASICDDVEKEAKKEKWGIIIEEPDDSDIVPTLIKNPKWVEYINPVFDMIGIIPGYKEIDTSAIFLIFFSLFVGMLVGDAGYGLLIAFIIGFFHFILRKRIVNPTIFILSYILCGVTIIWGVLTGVYFGQQWISSVIPPLLPWLSLGTNVELLCFIIGATHLSIAHIRKSIFKYPHISFLSDIGWVFIIWAMFFFARMFVIGIALPSFITILFIIGFPLIMLFTNPNKNIFKAINSVIINLPLSTIGAFTDVISYIRLYAVGLATVAVADSANHMSIFWVILLHTVNILLAAMAILVHGIRLNILEFSGHLGMEWSGIAYNPFKKAHCNNKS